MVDKGRGWEFGGGEGYRGARVLLDFIDFLTERLERIAVVREIKVGG